MGLVIALCSNLTLANDQMKTANFECDRIKFEMSYSDSENWKASVKLRQYSIEGGPQSGSSDASSNEEYTEYMFENCDVYWSKNQPDAVRCYNEAADARFELEEINGTKPYKGVKLSLYTLESSRSDDSQKSWRHMWLRTSAERCNFVN